MYTLVNDERADALRDAAGDLNPMSLQLWRLLCARTAWDLVLDVGANYGEMLLSFDLPERATVIAFEPSPEVVACLRQSVVESGLAIRVEALAVGAAAGQRTLFVDPKWSGTSTTAAEHARDGSRPVAVDVVRLDEYLDATPEGTRDRVLVKIDVEGGERDVLEGLESLRGHGRELMVQAEILHSSDEELRWMIRRYVVHLAHKVTNDLVPVARVSELREMVSSGEYYAQDAVLAAEPMVSLVAAADAPEVAWRRYAQSLREVLDEVEWHARHDREVAVLAERTRPTNQFPSRWSRRLARPFRSARRSRGRGSPDAG